MPKSKGRSNRKRPSTTRSVEPSTRNEHTAQSVPITKGEPFPKADPINAEPSAAKDAFASESTAADMTQKILQQMKVPEYDNAYTIGARAKRLTFLSQQQRALNLVWALKTTDHLPENAHVAVVGGGLAGVTAAAAAHLLGAKVTLLERKAELLHLQRGTHQRFIQPNIYDWPEPDTENTLTDLPFFNWGAGMASTIVETIVRQWAKLAGSVTLLLNHDVLRIRTQNEGKIWLRAEGPSGPQSGSGIYRDTFDVLILAVGFGLERQVETLPFLSYWENDNLGRPVMRGPLHSLHPRVGPAQSIDLPVVRVQKTWH